MGITIFFKRSIKVQYKAFLCSFIVIVVYKSVFFYTEDIILVI